MRTVEPEDFLNAVKVMVKLGWHKGSSVGPGGSVCAARALNIAAKERSGDYCDLDEAMKWLALPYTEKSAISRWNDLKSTQFEDIVTGFSLAAARMRDAGR